MAGDILDREYLDINGLEFEVETLSIEFDKASSVVNAMTKNKRPIGVVSGNQSATITADITVRESQLEYMDALDEYYRYDTEVPVIVMQEGGRSHSFTTGIVTGLSDSAGHGEAIKRSITMIAWGHSTI